MTIAKHGNWEYSGGVPLNDGDLYYSPDKIRDFQYLLDQMGRIMRSLASKAPCVLYGMVVSQGTGDTLDITAGAGLVMHSVTIPDTYAAFPPSTTTGDVCKLVEITAQNDLAISSATLDGATPNYVKVRYAETNGNSRARAYAAGSYNYERVPSFTITVDAAAPDANYDLVIASFVGSSGGAFTFSTATRPRPDIQGELEGIATTADGINEKGSGADVLHWKIIAIGDWNMDSTTDVTINLGIDGEKVKSVSVTIIDDSSAGLFDLFGGRGTDGGVPSYYTIFYSPTNTIKLTRTVGCGFDSALYNATSFNRGWITIGYID
jgi:hypothetical protein